MAPSTDNRNARNADFVDEAGERRSLPQNIEAEKSVLAASMLNADALTEIMTRIKPENFFRPSHRIIYEAMCDLNYRSIPVDPIQLADTLQAKGQLEAAGGRAYLAELADNTFALTNWSNHADIVKRTAILRELIYASAEIRALAYDAPDDLNVVVEEAEKTLFNVTEKRVSSDFTKMDNLLNSAMEEITQLAQQQTHEKLSFAVASYSGMAAAKALRFTRQPRRPISRTGGEAGWFSVTRDLPPAESTPRHRAGSPPRRRTAATRAAGGSGAGRKWSSAAGSWWSCPPSA